MTRDAYIHVRREGAPGKPTLFLFHGTGGDETQLFDLGGELMPDATLVSPRGDVSEHGAARFFRRTDEGVYDMDDLARATERMAGFIGAHKGDAPAFGLGYSNGANILASVIFRRPDLFDRAALMHPLIPFAPQVDGSLAGRRILMTAGRRDPICPPDLTRRLEAYLKALKAEVLLEWHEGGHELRPNEIEAARRFLADRETDHD